MEDGRITLSVLETHETIPALLAALQNWGARLLVLLLWGGLSYLLALHWFRWT